MPTTVTAKDGHSLQTGDGVFMPGEPVELESSDAKRLIDAGIAVEVAPAATETRPVPVKVLIPQIKAAATVEALDALITASEDRKSVLEVADARKTELTKAE